MMMYHLMSVVVTNKELDNNLQLPSCFRGDFFFFFFHKLAVLFNDMLVQVLSQLVYRDSFDAFNVLLRVI